MTDWNLTGKTILLTGATSGIGLEAAVVLASQGAHLVLVGRNKEKTEATVLEVCRRSGSSTVEFLLADFASQASIRALAAAFLERYPRLDVLVNNAGSVFKDRQLTEDGIEATFAVNHLGYFLLTHLLLERLKASAPSRVVHVASIGHRRATMDFQDLGYEKGYFIMKAYRRSKLGNVLFSNELARRLAGSGVTSNSLHPGGVATNIWTGAPGWAKPIITLFLRPFMLTPAQGGETIVHLVASPELSGVTGQYFEKNRPVAPAPLALDEELAGKVWEVSARMVKISR